VTNLGRQEQHHVGSWHTLLGAAILAATEDLFAEELAEIGQAREDLARALKAEKSAGRELILIQNSLAACEAALAKLPHEMMSQTLLESDDAPLAHLREERDRLLAKQGRLRERLIEAKAQAAKVATNEREETDKFARRVREAHARARAKRNEVHDRLERMLKEVDDQLGEAWSVALGPSEQVRG
jgi:chromosome segregation ATPase